MKIPLTYEEASKRYPNRVAKLMAEFRANEGKSKTKVLKGGAETVKWYITYGMRVGPNSRQERQELSIAAFCEKNVFASFGGTVNRYWHASVKFDKVPQEVLDAYKESENTREEARRFAASMSPQERKAKVNGLLKSLRVSPGFVEIRHVNDVQGE